MPIVRKSPGFSRNGQDERGEYGGGAVKSSPFCLFGSVTGNRVVVGGGWAVRAGAAGGFGGFCAVRGAGRENFEPKTLEGGLKGSY